MGMPLRVGRLHDTECSNILPGIFLPETAMPNQETRRWVQRPPGSTWGDFGPDDQLGRLNLLTPEKVRQGVAEVRDGRSFCLSLPLD